MLKFIFIFLMLLTAAPLAHAKHTMRDLAVEAMNDYGEKLYDRHDYKEATAVFKHILSYDPQNTEAQAYLNKIYPQPQIVINRPLVVQTSKPAVIEPVQILTSAAADDPNADLKEEIAAQDKALDVLKEEVRRMHLELNS